MKNRLSILLLSIVISGFTTPCPANPLSNIMSFFQRDLVINVRYANPKNIGAGSEVYLARDPSGAKVLIGKVTNVSLVEPQMFKVEIMIDKEFKEKIYETTPFVLMSKLFSEGSNPYIVAISSVDISEKKPLKSGDSVKGVTFLEYKISTAGNEFKKVMESLKKQNSEILTQLQQHIDTFDTEGFQKKIETLVDQISEFTAEQKEAFRNEVLPSLRKRFESMMEYLDKQNKPDKSKDLERQLKKIEGMVDV